MGMSAFLRNVENEYKYVNWKKEEKLGRSTKFENRKYEFELTII